MVLEWRGDFIFDKITEAVAQGAMTTAEDILADAVRNAPKMTATLRNSGTISYKILDSKAIYQQAKKGTKQAIPNVDKNKHRIYISFNTPYARRQHEDLTFDHTGEGKYYTFGGKKTYQKEGGAKYLEKAWNANIKEFKANVTLESKRLGLL